MIYNVCNKGERYNMEKFEYKTITVDIKHTITGYGKIPEGFDDELNKMGEEEWELVNIIPLTPCGGLGGGAVGRVGLVFKRRK